MAAAIGIAPNPKKTFSDKKPGMLSCFKCKKLGHLVRNYPEPPQDPVMNVPKQVTNGTGEWTVLTPGEGPCQPRLWMYQLKLHMTEEAQGALNSPHIRLSSLMRKFRWPWKSWVKKFYYLLICGVHYSVLPAFAGKPSSEITIVVGIDGKNKLKTSLLSSLAVLKLIFLCIDFLKSLVAPPLGNNEKF
jgi:hypothetical protein